MIIETQSRFLDFNIFLTKFEKTGSRTAVRTFVVKTHLLDFLSFS